MVGKLRIKKIRGTGVEVIHTPQEVIESHAKFADYFWDNDYMGLDIDRVRKIARSKANEHRQSGPKVSRRDPKISGDKSAGDVHESD